MKVVLVAAFLALVLGTLAHAAELTGSHAPVRKAYACVDLRHAMAPTATATVSPAQCCGVNGQCAQFISTDRLVRPSQRGRT
jgi:hypothetical protein